MTPAKKAETQKEADKVSALTQKFWRDSSMDYAEFIGKDNLRREDEAVALNFSNAKSSVEDLEKKIKANAKKKKDSK
jgi:hypothetical protein